MAPKTLLELPPEIRNIIFDEVLRPDPQEVRLYDPPTSTSSPPFNVPTFLKSMMVDRALTQLCQQTRSETTIQSYQINTFYVST